MLSDLRRYLKGDCIDEEQFSDDISGSNSMYAQRKISIVTEVYEQQETFEAIIN